MLELKFSRNIMNIPIREVMARTFQVPFSGNLEVICNWVWMTWSTLTRFASFWNFRWWDRLTSLTESRCSVPSRYRCSCIYTATCTTAFLSSCILESHFPLSTHLGSILYLHTRLERKEILNDTQEVTRDTSNQRYSFFKKLYLYFE